MGGELASGGFCRELRTMGRIFAVDQYLGGRVSAPKSQDASGMEPEQSIEASRPTSQPQMVVLAMRMGSRGEIGPRRMQAQKMGVFGLSRINVRQRHV